MCYNYVCCCKAHNGSQAKPAWRFFHAVSSKLKFSIAYQTQWPPSKGTFLLSCIMYIMCLAGTAKGNLMHMQHSCGANSDMLYYVCYVSHKFGSRTMTADTIRQSLCRVW